MEYVGFSEYSDVYQDIVKARAGNEQFDTESRRMEEDDSVDADYRDFLLSCIRAEKDLSTAYEEERQNNDGDNDNEYDSEDERDPEFELFLKNLKKHGESYALHNEADGLPLVVYEQDSGSDSELDPVPRRVTRSAMRNANEVSEQILDEEEVSGRGSDGELDPVPRRKTRSATRNARKVSEKILDDEEVSGRGSDSELDLVPRRKTRCSTKHGNENPSYRESVATTKRGKKMACKIDEIEADTEYQEFLRSCKTVDCVLAYQKGGHSVVYFSTSEKNDQENKMGDDDISDISSSDVKIIEMDENYLNGEVEFRRRVISVERACVSSQGLA